MSEKNNKNILYCSFCGKSQHEVRKLIAGPTVFICDECVELCMDIIKEENKSSLVKHEDGVPSPKEICNVLDEYVIGQKTAKEILICVNKINIDVNGPAYPVNLINTPPISAKKRFDAGPAKAIFIISSLGFAK